MKKIKFRSGFWRFFAYILDVLIIQTIYALISGDLYWNSLPEGGVEFGYSFSGLYAIPPIIITLLYFFLAEGYFGTTLFKFIFRMKIVDNKGNKCSWIQALIRTVSIVFETILLIGPIYYLFSPTNQRIGDYFAKTYVVPFKSNYKSENFKNLPKWGKTRKAVLVAVFIVTAYLVVSAFIRIYGGVKELNSVSREILNQIDESFEKQSLETLYNDLGSPILKESVPFDTFNQQILTEPIIKYALDDIKEIRFYNWRTVESESGEGQAEIIGEVTTNTGNVSTIIIDLYRSNDESDWKLIGFNAKIILSENPEVQKFIK
ncbi:RDD family protein [Patescibacteria group bacterium]